MKFLHKVIDEYKEDVFRLFLLTVVLVIIYFLISYGKYLAMIFELNS